MLNTPTDRVTATPAVPAPADSSAKLAADAHDTIGAQPKAAPADSHPAASKTAEAWTKAHTEVVRALADEIKNNHFVQGRTGVTLWDVAKTNLEVKGLSTPGGRVVNAEMQRIAKINHISVNADLRGIPLKLSERERATIEPTRAQVKAQETQLPELHIGPSPRERDAGQPIAEATVQPAVEKPTIYHFLGIPIIPCIASAQSGPNHDACGISRNDFAGGGEGGGGGGGNGNGC